MNQQIELQEVGPRFELKCEFCFYIVVNDSHFTRYFLNDNLHYIMVCFVLFNIQCASFAPFINGPGVGTPLSEINVIWHGWY